MRNVVKLAFIILLATSSVVASGCSPAKHAENVKEGDADFPVVNPHPVDIINLTMIVPASIKADLTQVYTARRGGGSVAEGPPCAYIETSTQARNPYWSEPSLALNRTSEGVYAGQVIVDRYTPGNCNWGLAGVWYDIGAGAPKHAELLRTEGSIPRISNGRLDLWCIRSKKRDPKLPEVCMGIRSLQSQFPEEISPSTVEKVISIGGGYGPPALITPDIQELVIQFHNLDAVDQDLKLTTR